MATSIGAELLELLVCPENHQPVAMAHEELLQELNRKIAAGEVLNCGGEKVQEALTAGLIRTDRRRLYPVKDGIPIMLKEAGIEL